ncbi:MAG: exodeoxyribonuclease VII large subunit [Congregibacter sp.]
MATTKQTTLTPSALNRQAKQLLESHFDFVWVEGELTNFARPSSGHWYFSLKDQSAQVRCAMFRNRNQRLRFQPENGDLVRLRARVSLYEGRGEFQLIGEFMEPAGAGQLQAQFEALRDKLKLEGLFEADRKKPLPSQVNHLAVISSPSGAALQDILQVLARRNPAIRVTVFATAVQGEGAAAQIVNALEQANDLRMKRPDCDFDAIILARGGGSLEDLWAFNDEGMARAVAASHLPVVTGVGHEIDFTIADFAADARAPTPSAAAELLSDDKQELVQRLDLQGQRLTRAMELRLEKQRLVFSALRDRLRHPGDRLREQYQRLDDREARLRRAILEQLRHARGRIEHQRQRLNAMSPADKIMRKRQTLTQDAARMRAATESRLAAHAHFLQRSEQLLRSLSPLAVLGRGYAILEDERGHIVRQAGTVEPEQRLRARLAEGRLRLRVEETSG